MARISSRFGVVRSDGTIHKGLDLAVEVGTPIKSIADGKVDAIWTEGEGGLCIRIAYRSASGGYAGDNSASDDSGPLMTVAHLSDTVAKEGQMVRRGEVIAHSGNSGSKTTGAHAHFMMELYVDTAFWPNFSKARSTEEDGHTWIDPLPFFGGAAAVEGKQRKRAPLPRSIRSVVAEKGKPLRTSTINITGNGNAISVGGVAVGVNLKTALGLGPASDAHAGEGGQSGPPIGRKRGDNGGNNALVVGAGIGGAIALGAGPLGWVTLPVAAAAGGIIANFVDTGRPPNINDILAGAHFVESLASSKDLVAVVQGAGAVGKLAGQAVGAAGNIVSLASPALAAIPYVGEAAPIVGTVASIAGPIISGVSGAAQGGAPVAGALIGAVPIPKSPSANSPADNPVVAFDAFATPQPMSF